MAKTVVQRTYYCTQILLMATGYVGSPPLPLCPLKNELFALAASQQLGETKARENIYLEMCLAVWADAYLCTVYQCLYSIIGGKMWKVTVSNCLQTCVRLVVIGVN